MKIEGQVLIMFKIFERFFYPGGNPTTLTSEYLDLSHLSRNIFSLLL